MQYRDSPSRIPLAAAVLVALALSLSFSKAQDALTADGVIESTAGGFRFPDGTVQTTALSASSLADTGQQGCWDELGAIEACAGTGQDGELQKGVPWPSPRFAANGDGTVTDHLTGLVWLQNTSCLAISPADWDTALASANGLMAGDCGLSDGSVPTDWRLPNIRELASLMDYGSFGPALPTGHPFLTAPSGVYWSSTSFAQGPGSAWSLDLFTGDTGETAKNLARSVWPVKGGS